MFEAFAKFDGPIVQSLMAALAPGREDRDEANSPDVKWNLPGFLGSARVSTAFGELPIQALRIRDEILTASGAIARVQWIDKLHLDEEYLALHPSARPVRIPANGLAQGIPLNEVTVSPEQLLSVDAHAASRFLPASELCNRARAHRVQPSGLTYYRFHCGYPVNVRVEGMLVRV